MLRVFIHILVVASVELATTPWVAAEINQRQNLDPGANAKVQRHIAKAWAQDGGQDTATTGPDEQCGNQGVGNVVVPRGTQSPREVITVVRGDVINVVGPGGCR